MRLLLWQILHQDDERVHPTHKQLDRADAGEGQQWKERVQQSRRGSGVTGREEVVRVDHLGKHKVQENARHEQKGDPTTNRKPKSHKTNNTNTSTPNSRYIPLLQF